MQTPPIDQELWKSFRNGDREAFTCIYNSQISGLLSYGYRITSDNQLIRDSVHDLFLHLWLHRATISNTDSIRFYLFRALRNRLLQNLRDTPLKQEQGIEDLLDGLLTDISVEQMIINEETENSQISALKKAIDQLPLRQQEAIQLRYFHGFSTEQIASVLNINNQSVKNLLYRSLSHLREFFELDGRNNFQFFTKKLIFPLSK